MLITNVTEIGRILTLENVVAGRNVRIDNNGHLEATVRATESVEIRNASVRTLVGTYAGATVSLTNGVDAACVMLDQAVLGTVKTDTFDLYGDTMLVTFSLAADAPWKTVTAGTTYLLFSGDLSDVVVGTGNVLRPTAVERLADGSYRATFVKPTAATGFFCVCVGE